MIVGKIICKYNIFKTLKNILKVYENYFYYILSTYIKNTQ